MQRLGILSMVGLLFLCAPLLAAAEEYQTGDWVIVTENCSLLDEDGAELVPISIAERFMVKEAREKDVLVVSEPEGYLLRSQILPSEETGIALLEEKIKANPNNAELYLLRAVQVARPKDRSTFPDGAVPAAQLEAAKLDLDKAVELGSEITHVRLLRAGIHKDLHQWQLAVDDFTHVLTASPNHMWALYGRATALQYLEEHQKAVDDLTPFLDIVKTTQANDQELIAQATLDRAFSYRELGKYDQAKTDLSVVLRLFPTNLNALREMGNVSIDEGDYYRTYTCGTTMTYVAPQNDTGYRLRAIALTKQGKNEEALPEINRALELPPERASEYSLRCDIFAKTNQLEKALADIEHADKLEPNSAVYQNKLGLILSKLGRHKEALAHFNESLRLEPGSMIVLDNRANELILLREYRKAIDDLNIVLRDDPQHVRALCNRGTAWRELGDFAKAQRDLDDAVRLGPNFADAWTCRATLDIQLGLYAEAKQAALRCQQLTPKAAPNLLILGRALLELGEHPQALQCLDQCIELAPEQPYGYNLRGLVYFNTGELEKAFEDFDQAISLNPEFTMAYINRGNTFLQMEYHDDAITDYDTAIRLGPPSYLAYHGRGLAKFYLSDLEGSVIDFTRAIELSPLSPDTLVMRAQTYTSLEQYSAAKKDLAASLELAPKDADALYTLAQVRLLEHDLNGVEPFLAYLSQLESCQGNSCTMVVFLGLYGELLQKPQQVAPLLAAARKKMPEDQMLMPYVDYLQGKITRAELAQLPIYNDEEYLAPRCFRGLLALIDNRSEQAREDFRWVMENGDITSYEVDFARAELSRMDAMP
ncbi:tetratricopeptide repeat protein [Blastopirellula marina]|uniref:Uncharacterized protein n=1 Tax=Blastopirellula marina TaxID=124 RepID=A0A2S8G888_9BACT|nr:tetratricopeptide repeat protein [Blastopirellula marina]PQO40672.1 hypothetical protein C5Y98_05470 [Blastopirellula marina]PTL45632.1 tetratricopeptide repeat protein [Blastopirellula marina]